MGGPWWHHSSILSISCLPPSKTASTRPSSILRTQPFNFSPVAVSANLGYRFYAHRLHRFYTCDWPVNPMLPSPFAVVGKGDGVTVACG